MPANQMIAKQMLAAQCLLQEVPKDASNDYHGYTYTSAEQMLKSARSALAEAGVAVSATDYSLIFVTQVPMVQVTFDRVSDGISHVDTCQWPVVESKGRPFDKAYAGAITTAINYYLRGLLLIPRTDIEVDTRDDTQYEVKPKGKYSPETHGLAKELADKWPGEHTEDEVLLLFESRTGKSDDDSAWEFIKSSLSRLAQAKEVTDGIK